MKIPNHRLQAARKRRGMSRAEVAEAVSFWLTSRDPKHRDVAFDVTHLGKIERGDVARPRDHYVAALCAILQSTEAELGFDHTSRATPEDVDRKAFLQAAFGAGAGAMIASRLSDHDATDLVAAITGPTGHYRRMSDTVSTMELTPAVEAHLRLASSVVTNMLPSREGFAALSEAAVLAAWVARERDDTGTARRHYAEAVRYAERAQHPLLTTLMLVSRGHFAVESGEPEQGLTLLQGARWELEQADAPESAHAWMAAFLADAYAEVGDRTATYRELRRAESLAGGEYRWPWVRSFEEAVAGYQASTLAKLDDLSAARTAFAAAAPTLSAPKPRAEAQVHHARALAHAGQIEEACALANEALAVSRQFGAERIVRRVRALRAELPPHVALGEVF